jgi:trans-aconitate methyltransferase
MVENSTASYDMVAEEYYDSVRHPTCANFRQLSARYLSKQLETRRLDGSLAEVGCGRSLLAELIEGKRSMDGVVLTDQSEAMLRYSDRYASMGASLLVSDARDIWRSLSNLALVVASLADPYNEPAFWKSVFKCLAPGGEVMCTLPSFQWARIFRGRTHSPIEVAEFTLRDGQRHFLPSFILSLSNQVAMVEDSGLVITHFEALTVESIAIGTRLSPKLLAANDPSMPVIYGFTARRCT